MPYSFTCDCDWRLAFTLGPAREGCVGYLTDFNGLGGLSLVKDLGLYNLYTSPGLTYGPIALMGRMVTVVAVLDTFSWAGGDEDPLSFSCYISKNNAASLRAKLAAPLASTSITFGWWIANYDHNSQQWFEEVYPRDPERPSGRLNTREGKLQIQLADQSVQVENPTYNVYKVDFEIVPREGQTVTISLATSPTARAIGNWGSQDD